MDAGTHQIPPGPIGGLVGEGEAPTLVSISPPPMYHPEMPSFDTTYAEYGY